MYMYNYHYTCICMYMYMYMDNHYTCMYVRVYNHYICTVCYYFFFNLKKFFLHVYTCICIYIYILVLSMHYVPIIWEHNRWETILVFPAYTCTVYI